MPQPAALDTLQEPLIDAYRRAWERVQAEQEALAADPLAYRRKMRLVELRRSIEQAMDGLDAQAGQWVSEQLPQAYAAGMESAPGAASPLWAQIHQEAVEELAQGLFEELLQATDGVRDSTKRLVREVGRDAALQKALTGQTAKQASQEMRRVLEAKGIHSITYSNGTKHGLAEYTQVAMRTTTAKAYNRGTLGAHSDVAYFEIFDGPNCGLTSHDDSQLALGMVVDRATSEAHLISHPNAVMEGTSVSVLGRAVGAYAARWSGPVVRLSTLGGRQLTVGPNHPVLTSRGWVRADELGEGDEVVCEARSGRATSIEEDVNDRPPLVENLFETLRSVGLNSWVAAVPVQFHGDGNFCEGEVSIVDVEGELSEVANAALVEKHGELVLNLADPEHPLVSSLRPLPFGLNAIDLTTSSLPHEAKIPGVGSSVAELVEPCFSESPANGTLADPQFLRDLGEGLACEVELDSLVLVERYAWSGHAYDLETSTAMYVADGIIVHNCRRAFGPRPDIGSAEAAQAAKPSTTPEQRRAQLEQDASRGDRMAQSVLERSDAREARLAQRGVAERQAKLDARAAARPPLSGDEALRSVWDVSVREDLDPLTSKAIKSYTYSGYEPMNDRLRGKPSSPADEAIIGERINALTKIIDESRLPAPVEVWRGWGNIPEEMFPEGASVGMEFTDKAFMSTSTNRNVANVFSSRGVLTRIAVPGGHTALQVDAPRGEFGSFEDFLKSSDNECEILLAPGTRFRVVGDSLASDGRRVLDMEVIGNERYGPDY